jgi:hypothetical protein
MMQQEALICCLNLQEHIIIVTIRTTKTKQNQKSTDDETKSDLKLEGLYNNYQMFLEMWGFFWVRRIKDHNIRFLKFRVTTTKFGQLSY